MDAPLLDATDDALARPLPAAIRRARADILEAARTLAAIPADRLAGEWPWHDGQEIEVRYAAYRAAEALEVAELEARTLLASADGAERQAARLLGPMTAARWDLHGLVLPLSDDQLDADPGAGEWTLRLVLGHIISGQRAYAWSDAWIARHADAALATDPAAPVRPPEAFWDALPDEATTEAEGDMAALRARLDAIVDLSGERLGGLDDDRMAIPSRWSGASVTLGFRLGRCASHIREHTIQVEKTLALLGHVPDETARLVRHVLAAYGRAEAAVFGRVGTDAAAEPLAIASAEALDVLRGAAAASEA